MNITSITNNIKKRGFLGAAKSYSKKMLRSDTPTTEKSPAHKYTILLLTNKDSDNVGDQIIEACDVSILHAIMKNLGISNYKIVSKPATIVKEPYDKPDGEHLNNARKLIQDCDVVIYGGTPVFNYLYQTFYKRTSLTIDIAGEYGKPVILSAIGVDRYDEGNEKCERISAAINQPHVRLVTTRDNFDTLVKFRRPEHSSLPMSTVSDPAVFAGPVFLPFLSEHSDSKKKIGLFILRRNGFTDNYFDFPGTAAARFWLDLAAELERRGYDYEFLTSGHFGDEAFLDYLIRNYNVPPAKCIFNVNSPEFLAEKISSYDGVISCRLHPSIISFALDVPCIGINWNNKVSGFYHNIGYDDRVLYVDQLSAVGVADKIEQVMKEGIHKDETFIMSVYRTLFQSIKEIFAPESDAEAYSLEELSDILPPYGGTSEKEQLAKLRRKFRRTYQGYNNLFDKLSECKKSKEDAQ